MMITNQHRDRLKIKIWQEGKPVFKERGEEKTVKKKLAEWFKFKT